MIIVTFAKLLVMSMVANSLLGIDSNLANNSFSFLSAFICSLSAGESEKNAVSEPDMKAEMRINISIKMTATIEPRLTP